jgi:hypothetical protein
MQTSKLLRACWLARGASWKTVSRTTQRLKPSRGHAILERNSGVIAVYHPDGVHSLLMTLYTREGNQPRLRAKGFGENPNQMILVFQDITNWKKGRNTSIVSSSFLRARSPDRKVGDVEAGRNENAFRIRTDPEKRQVIAKESRKGVVIRLFGSGCARKQFFSLLPPGLVATTLPRKIH